MMSATIALAAALAVPTHGLIRTGERWALATPERRAWWSVAPCCTGPGANWDSFDPKNPGYAGHRLFDTPKDWALDTQAKLKEWGFNSLAGWSEIEVFKKHGGSGRLPYFVVLHLGAYYKAPWEDMFSKEFEEAASKAAQDQIEKLKGDQYLVGYFTDNELGWWDDTLFMHYLAMPPSAPGRRKLISLLKSRYNSFKNLKKDWITQSNTFDELNAGGKLSLRPGSDGMQTINAWTKTLATHYYSSMHRMVRKHDPKRMILGDRYAQYWELPVVEAAKPFVDVISTNYGADWFDGSLSRFFLDTLHELTGKPVIIGEFYMNAMQNQSGNGNTVKAFPIVETQEQRADATARNLKELAQRPYVVGAHWFQFFDHPPKGRGDGEDNNMGLVDTMGRPYPLLTKVFKEFSWEATKPVTPQSCRTIPKFIPSHKEGLRDWPRAEGWVKPIERAAFGDLYLAQDSDSLWVGVMCADYMDERIYEEGRIPEPERPSISLRLPGLNAPLTVTFGGKGQAASCAMKDVTIKEWPALKHQLAIKIPWSLLASTDAHLSVEAVMFQHSRAARMSWKTQARTGR